MAKQVGSDRPTARPCAEPSLETVTYSFIEELHQRGQPKFVIKDPRKFVAREGDHRILSAYCLLLSEHGLQVTLSVRIYRLSIHVGASAATAQQVDTLLRQVSKVRDADDIALVEYAAIDQDGSR